MCPVQNEYKFTSDSIEDSDRYLTSILSFLKMTGTYYMSSDRCYTDHYYDSPEMEITKAGCSLRRRTYIDGSNALIVKRPIFKDEIIARELTVRSSDGSFNDFNAFMNDNFPGVTVGDEPVLTLECDRVLLFLADMNHTMLSLDKCRFVDGNNSSTFIDIDLQLVSNTVRSDYDKVGIVDHISDTLGLHTITDSKYDRGLLWKNDLCE